MSRKQKSMAAAATGGHSGEGTEHKPGAPQLIELAEAEIAARAYSYWAGRGFQGGTPEEDWDRAIQELKAEHGHNG